MKKKHKGKAIFLLPTQDRRQNHSASIIVVAFIPIWQDLIQIIDGSSSFKFVKIYSQLTFTRSKSKIETLVQNV